MVFLLLIPPPQVVCTHEDLYDDELLQYGGLEFPAINYAQHNARPYRYYYACGFGHVFGDSLLKMDVQTKQLKVCLSELKYNTSPHAAAMLVHSSGQHASCFSMKMDRFDRHHTEYGH